MTQSASPAATATADTTDVRGQRFIGYQYEDLKNSGNDPYRAAKWDVLTAWLPKGKTLDILNAGCGSGEFSFALASMGHKVDSIDPGEEYVDLARKAAAGTPFAHCMFEVADIASYRDANPNRKYDLVVSTDVIEHIEDDVGTVKVLCDMLKPGGNLMLTVPAGQYLFGYHDEQLGHYRRYSKKMARSVLPPGMTVQKLRYFGMSLVPVAWLYSVKKRTNYPVPQPKEGGGTPIARHVLNGVLAFEKALPLPLGTSCLMWAQKQSS